MKTAPKSVPHEHHDCFSSFNQSNHLFVASSLPLLSSFLSTDALIHLRGLVFLLHFKTLARPTQTKCHVCVWLLTAFFRHFDIEERIKRLRNVKSEGGKCGAVITTFARACSEPEHWKLLVYAQTKRDTF